jgi:hypothetical protein
MLTGVRASVQSLSDEALLAGTRSLVSRERQLTAHFVAHLGEVEARGLHLREGHSSLFVYCRDALGLSEWESYGRIEAARAARKFPLVLELLMDGSITITSVGLLARHLTHENHRAALESACGKKKAEVEEIVARLRPRADVPTIVRKLPMPATASPPASSWPVASAAAGDPPEAAGGRSVTPNPAAEPPPPRTAPPRVPAPAPAPLSEDRYKYQLTIDRETRELLSLAKDMLRHADPGADDGALLKRALELLVSDLARRKFGAAEARATATAHPTASGSRHVPAQVKRAVFVRDRGRCAFVGRLGRRCDERGFLEFHHLKPFAIGGLATAENIALRCRRHNQYEARAYFARGDEAWTRAGPPGPRDDALA